MSKNTPVIKVMCCCKTWANHSTKNLSGIYWVVLMIKLVMWKIITQRVKVPHQPPLSLNKLCCATMEQMIGFHWKLADWCDLADTAEAIVAAAIQHRQHSDYSIPVWRSWSLCLLSTTLDHHHYLWTNSLAILQDEVTKRLPTLHCTPITWPNSFGHQEQSDSVLQSKRYVCWVGISL